MDFEWAPYLWKLLPVLLVFFGVLSIVPILVFFERKGAGYIQDRVGPNRVGLLGPDGLMEGLLGWRVTSRRFLGGLIQPAADVIKLIGKEDFIPAKADKVLFTLAPMMALLPPLLAFIVVPVGADLDVGRVDASGGSMLLPLQVADLNIGILWVLSVASLSAYGLALGGWASNNKFSLMGGVRATAQMISYEIGMGLIILCMVMQYQTLSLRTMVDAQTQELFWIIPQWGILTQPLAFVIFVICAFAENNRLPFDLPECEAELVGGFHTEYNSLKFGMFFQGEYIAMVAMGALTTTLFLGGWHFPGYAELRRAAGDAFLANLGITLLTLASFGLKTLCFVLFQIWVRWTLPRFRYDQLMNIGWKGIIPLALLNVVITAAMVLA
jgi:NADH-quinone oxidoreductase subunit H